MKILQTSQNTNDILLYLAVICLCFVIFLLYTALSSRGRTLTGPATVASRRVEHARFSGGKYSGQNWNNLVTFRLADGEEIELYTGQSEYRQLKEGLTGQLSWHRDNFVSFDFDENQRNYTGTPPIW